jgi:hypothetical protein
MAKRAAFAMLGLVSFVFAGRADAQDDAACAKYEEPVAYNACLARHGPKANDVGRLRAGTGRPGASASEGRGDVHATRKRGRAHLEFLVK